MHCPASFSFLLLLPYSMIFMVIYLHIKCSGCDLDLLKLYLQFCTLISPIWAIYRPLLEIPLQMQLWGFHQCQEMLVYLSEFSFDILLLAYIELQLLDAGPTK